MSTSSMWNGCLVSSMLIYFFCILAGSANGVAGLVFLACGTISHAALGVFVTRLKSIADAAQEPKP